jgi:hypothetical protein
VSVDVGVGVSVGTGDCVGEGVAVDGVKTSSVCVIEGVSVGPGMGVSLGRAGLALAVRVGETTGVGVASPGARRMAINPAQ